MKTTSSPSIQAKPKIDKLDGPDTIKGRIHKPDMVRAWDSYFLEWKSSSKSHPASETVVLCPDSRSMNSVSCASCVFCVFCAFCASGTRVPHLVASGESGHGSQYRVPSGHMQLSNPASHAFRLQPQPHRTSRFTTSPWVSSQPSQRAGPRVRKEYILPKKISLVLAQGEKAIVPLILVCTKDSG